MPSGTVSDARAILLFNAPAGESIAGGDITLAPKAATESGTNEGTYAVAQLAKGSPEHVFWQSINLGVPPTVAIPAGASELVASVLCGGSPGRICRSESLYVISAHILLSPSATPSVSALSGSLTAGGLQHGTQNVSFTASDPGGPGIYQVTATVDGKTIYQATPNLNGGACAPVGDYGSALEFYSAHPCPQTLPVSVPVQTGTLADGIHSLVVTATDAASNLSSASQVIFRTENLISAAGAGRVPRGANSPGSAYLVRFDGRTAALLRGVRRSYADSSLTLSGTLTTPQGAVAPDVPVHLLGRDGVDPGGTEAVLASTTTDAAGHWSLTAPRGPSRTLSVDYGQASTASTASTNVTESVSPNMSLRITDRRGGRLSFTGRVSVSPLGRPRPIVVVEASADGRHWQVVGQQGRTDSQGIYHLSDSSPLSVGGHFAFRSVTPATSMWLQGSTRARWIRVR